MRKRHTLQGTVLCSSFLLAGSIAVGCGSPDTQPKERSGAIETGLASQPGDGGLVPTDGGTFGEGGGPGEPVGNWHFDDCSPRTKTLLDSAGGANATHRTGSTCVPSVSGLAVSIGSASDVVTIPDDPQFSLSNHIAVAAWINPTQVSGTHPVVVKGSGSHVPFSLSIHKGSVELTVQLSTGKSVTSSAPISANAWSHVGAFYDGQFVFLFLNGEQVGQIDHPGKLADVRDPILVGGSSSGQHFQGLIDELWISTNPVVANDITS